MLPVEEQAASTVLNQEPDLLLEKEDCRNRITLATWDQAQQLHSLVCSVQACLCTEKIDNKNMKIVGEDVVASLSSVRPVSWEQYFGFTTASGEAITNGIRDRRPDGKPYLPERYRKATVQYGVLARNLVEADPRPRFILRVHDEGKGFDPRVVPNFLLPKNMEEQNGRGMYMMMYFICLRKQHHLDGKITFFPMDRHTDGRKFRTRDVTIEIPLEGDPAQLMDAFLNHDTSPRAYPPTIWAGANDETVT